MNPRELKVALLVAVNSDDELAARWVLDQADRVVVETALLDHVRRAVGVLRCFHSDPDDPFVDVVEATAATLRAVALEVATDG